MKNTLVTLTGIILFFVSSYLIKKSQVTSTQHVQYNGEIAVATTLSSGEMFLSETGNLPLSGTRLYLKNGTVVRAGTVLSARGYPPVQTWNPPTTEELVLYRHCFHLDD